MRSYSVISSLCRLRVLARVYEPTSVILLSLDDPFPSLASSGQVYALFSSWKIRLVTQEMLPFRSIEQSGFKSSIAESRVVLCDDPTAPLEKFAVICV